MKTSDHRKSIPVGVKLHACLLLLGFTDEDIKQGLEWDHFPALALRAVDAETGELIPASNDPRFIRPLRRSEHATKTFGRGGEKRICTAGSDLGNAAKVRRITKAEEDFRRKLLAKSDPDAPVVSVERRRKAKIPSRPFPKGHRPMGNRQKQKKRGPA